MILLAKLKTYALAAMAVLAAIASAWLYGRHKGRQAAEQAEAVHDAQANAAAAQDVIQTQESRHATDQAVQHLPDAPAQAVGKADPSTAAGKLDAGGWTRD